MLLLLLLVTVDFICALENFIILYALKQINCKLILETWLVFPCAYICDHQWLYDDIL